jgi:ribonuclease HII
MQTGLMKRFSQHALEAGCDEAGRGCLAGPVFAAAVILPSDLDPELAGMLNDSKKLKPEKRDLLRFHIEQQALSWAVAQISHEEIDQVNILKASIMAMHAALRKLPRQPEFILVDGNRFLPYDQVPFQCIVKGDGLYMSIAAASILAKTHRDEHMQALHLKCPHYGWDQNKGYPTTRHREAIAIHGLSPHHRRSFKSGWQLKIDW